MYVISMFVGEASYEIPTYPYFDQYQIQIGKKQYNNNIKHINTYIYIYI